LENAIKKIVLRMFPALSGNYHLPMFARVVAVSDPLTQPGLSEAFRPRYAVDIQVLLANGDDDTALDIYRAVPLPVACAGIERGHFGFPEPGTIVEIAFGYGKPDLLFIRSILGNGLGMPELATGDMLWAHSNGVNQKVNGGGDWSRETHGAITDTSRIRNIDADDNVETYNNSTQKVDEHSIELVAGVKLIEAMGALKLVSGGAANLSAVDNLNLTTGSDLNQVVCRDKKTTVAGDDVETITQLKKIEAATLELKSTAITMGDETNDVLALFSDLLALVNDLATALSTHSHTHAGLAGTTTAVVQTVGFVTTATNATTLQTKLKTLMPSTDP